MSRKLSSGLLVLECQDCQHQFEEFSRDVDSMSDHYCPNCDSCDVDVVDYTLDDVWTQDALESANQRATSLRKKLFNKP